MPAINRIGVRASLMPRSSTSLADRSIFGQSGNTTVQGQRDAVIAARQAAIIPAGTISVRLPRPRNAAPSRPIHAEISVSEPRLALSFVGTGETDPPA